MTELIFVLGAGLLLRLLKKHFTVRSAVIKILTDPPIAEDVDMIFTERLLMLSRLTEVLAITDLHNIKNTPMADGARLEL
jgi:hypothetical protein